MKYAVIGAGGMGIQYGVLLQEFAHKDVDFVDTWKPNVEKIREQGGAYVSQDGEDRHLVPINVYYPEEYAGQPDVWIVFLKQMQLDGVLKRCAHLFNEKQIVFSAMNGYGHFEKLNEYFSTDRIYGGTALIGAYVYGPGDFNFTGGVHAKAMNLCAYADDVTDEVRKHEQALYEDFATATLNPTIVDNFIGMCMAKIVFNSVLNTLCTMYQIRFGEFHAHPDARWLTEQLVDEAYSAAEAAGYQLLGTRNGSRNHSAHRGRGTSAALSVHVSRPDQGTSNGSRLHQRLYRQSRTRAWLRMQAARIPNPRSASRRTSLRHPQSRHRRTGQSRRRSQ